MNMINIDFLLILSESAAKQGDFERADELLNKAEEFVLLAMNKEDEEEVST